MNANRIRALTSGAALGLSVAALGTLSLPSCSRSPALPPPDQTYTVRGRIEMLPDARKPGSELQIQHEPISTFVNMQGKVQPMDSMIMPFEPAPGVSLNGLGVGDPVEFTFEVRWKSRPAMQLTRIQKLPDGTQLHLGRATGG